MARALIPNSTQIPDVILDRWMAELSGAEFKVLLYVARRTYGFGKESDTISLRQIAEGITRRDGTILDRGTGVSRMSVTRALKVLEEQGIIIRKHNLSEKNREYEENTYSINLDWEPPVKEGPSGGGSGGDDPAPKKAGEGVVTKCDHLVTRGEQRWYQNVTRVVTKVYPQETDLQETDQETAAKGNGEPPVGDAAAALVEELVSHGLGRAAALRLAQEKPDTCRCQLEYLPHARFKTTKGAWLANAIRDEYGPPPGYEAEQARREREQGEAAKRLADEALMRREASIREEKRARVGELYRQLEDEQGEAFSAFAEHVESERVRTARIARYLSPKRQDELLSAFDQPERRLELFEAWMSTDPVTLSQGSPFPHNGGADPSHEPEALRAEKVGGLFTAQAS